MATQIWSSALRGEPKRNLRANLEKARLRSRRLLLHHRLERQQLLLVLHENTAGNITGIEEIRPDEINEDVASN